MVDIQAVLGGTAAVQGDVPQSHCGAVLNVHQAGTAAVVAGDGEGALLGKEPVTAAVQGQVLGNGQGALAVGQAGGIQLHIPPQLDDIVLLRRGNGRL